MRSKRGERFMASNNKPAKQERSAWSGKLAFILAGAASAVGLGNLWRFPTPQFGS
jgi:NSS family neurotransmitter:Na+ symporter